MRQLGSEENTTCSRISCLVHWGLHLSITQIDMINIQRMSKHLFSRMPNTSPNISKERVPLVDPKLQGARIYRRLRFLRLMALRVPDDPPQSTPSSLHDMPYIVA